jgi:hypothetical protein
LSEFPIDMSTLKKSYKNNQSIIRDYEANWQVIRWAVKAQEVKQTKGLDNLEKRLLKAQKRKLSDIGTHNRFTKRIVS